MSRLQAALYLTASVLMFGFLAGLSGGMASTVNSASMSHGLCVAGSVVSGILGVLCLMILIFGVLLEDF